MVNLQKQQAASLAAAASFNRPLMCEGDADDLRYGSLRCRIRLSGVYQSCAGTGGMASCAAFAHCRRPPESWTAPTGIECLH